ncbi:hypothetical protein NLI96_g10815 [Meripilus lineatus]|uniref:DNA 3'-5' helicase n=1 Tax=Meripilus lineatus TaxID=2056292 RepID=A0AAD5USY3_9APHY|nr:hypothetical protein NLI96_g10815 [Physisporinus lineatus]
MSLSDFEDDSIMLDSDDSRLEEIIQRSRLDAQTFNNPAAGPSRLNAVPSNVSHSKDRLDEINTKIDNARKQSEHWQRELEVLIASKERIERDLVPKLTPPTSRPHPSNGKGKAPDVLTNYYDDTFPWSDSLRSRLKTVFGHDSFRVCQEAICNAVLDGQDTMTVMPTGIVILQFHPHSPSHSCIAAGKSLTYQLPAIFCRGLTIVISPLIALMNDQIQHLKDVGVSAVMLTSATDRDERNQIFSKISSMKEKDVPDGYKLLYLSPEMYYNNDGLKAKLDVLHRAKKLGTRICIPFLA